MAHLLRIDSSLRGEVSFPRSVADTFQNAWQQARGRQAVLVNARGGSYPPGTPREGWDHAEPYLRRVLADVLGLDLLVITPELTLADVNPALAQFIDRHRVSLAEAHGTAATAGRELVGQLAA